MYTKILVPLDGSRRSETVLPFAAAFASAFSIPVQLFHAVETDVANLKRLVQAKQAGSFDEDDLATTANSYLQRQAQAIPESLPVRFTVKIGNAADLIVEETATDKGALVAMATRGLSDAKRWLLGSVADKVLQAATNPLLLIKESSEEERAGRYDLKELLVPLDGSLLAETALPHAIAIAKSLGLKATLLRAYEVPISVATPLPYTVDADRVTLEAMREEVENYLREKVSQLASQGVKEVSHVAALGGAGQQIVDAAGPQTLIVMCTHGRSGMGRWFLGSVASRVSHHSSGPVLVVRAAPAS